jgi:hypothetical protein
MLSGRIVKFLVHALIVTAHSNIGKQKVRLPTETTQVNTTTYLNKAPRKSNFSQYRWPNTQYPARGLGAGQIEKPYPLPQKVPEPDHSGP